MIAKKILRVASFVMLMAIAVPAHSTVIVPATSQTNSTTKTDDLRVQELLQRLEYLRGMNKSELTRLEKKNLRKEVKEIRKEMKTLSRGVYLSVGAIVIIVLLLLLLL